jgi:hypothetical protein
MFDFMYKMTIFVGGRKWEIVDNSPKILQK